MSVVVRRKGLRRVLVTGAAGFIGSHLIEALTQLELEVIGIDNLQVGQLKNLKTSFGKKNFEFYNIDITQRKSLETIRGDFDYVLHLAALADIVPSITNPSGYFDSNVQGTLNVLELARQAKVRKILYAASSSCYGIPESFPTNEDARLDPRYPYALSKMMGEQLVLHWKSVYQIEAVSLRLFNVFGPRARTSGTYGAVFGVFLAQRLANKPLTIVGDGNQVRDFTHVRDVCDAFIACMESKVANGIYNVGSGVTFSINNLAELIGGPRVYLPKRPGEPDITHADISRIVKEVGWSPKMDFRAGVSEMIERIDEWSDAPIWDESSIAVATREWFQYLSGKQGDD